MHLLVSNSNLSHKPQDEDENQIPDVMQGQVGGGGGFENTIHQVCKRFDGKFGFVYEGVCVLEYSNESVTDWNTAASVCVARGGDLCSPAQYYILRSNDPELFYSGRAVWANQFSDNDGGNKNFALQSSDDPNISQQYSYGCCGRVTAEPFRSQITNINGVPTLYIHNREDTTWRSASKICALRGGDLCTKSQYISLNDANTFSNGSMRRWTSEMSDNDDGLFNGIVGSNTSDNPSWDHRGAFACCGTNLGVNYECPGQRLENGLCVVRIEDTGNSTFFEAARDCNSRGADVCCKSQMQTLKNAAKFFGQGWTNDGADNDSNQSGGVLGNQANNPNPNSTRYGYACCL